MMREVFKEKGQPISGVCPDAKVDHAIMDLRVDLDLMTFWLVGDRLPGTSSAILGDFILRRAHMDGQVTSSLPFPLLNFAVNLRRLSVTCDKIGIELEIGESFIL